MILGHFAKQLFPNRRLPIHFFRQRTFDNDFFSKGGKKNSLESCLMLLVHLKKATKI